MPLWPSDKTTARGMQLLAAHDQTRTVRLVAGPGTGKSASIEERFRWLYSGRGIDPRHVYGVSFTRAASKHLKLRVAAYCEGQAIPVAEDQIRVSTLHSLALLTLYRAGLLTKYPVRPLVLDEWEVSSIFDAEFAAVTNYQPSRARQIREASEAFWSTGRLDPANYIHPDPPISPEERVAFDAFHGPATQTYGCVLPGEIVRRCVERIRAGLLSPTAVLDLKYFIVDEYQDLNPMDLDFVDSLADQDVQVFVAGDDDQSVYPFRFASPAGIQDCPTRHPGSRDHILEGCFRCAPRIIAAANDLIDHNSSGNRIPKETVSLWETAEPPVDGAVYRWRFGSHVAEANAIARSCRRLIDAGVSANDIMMLLSNRRLFDRIRGAFESAGIPYTPIRDVAWRDTDAGRFALAMVRAVCSDEDYVALRLILGCPRGVGSGRCSRIVRKTLDNGIRYRDLFYEPLPPGIFNAAETNALTRAQAVCSTLSEVTADDLLDTHGSLLRELILEARSEGEATGWGLARSELPGATVLGEIRDYLWADSSEQRHALLAAVNNRLGLPTVEQIPEPRVRVMTMHGAKGLEAQVVFIPGLEDQLLPGPHRIPVVGLTQEGARLLYLSLTRARAAAVLSYASRRFVAGSMALHTASRYCANLGGPFEFRGSGLGDDEVAAVTDAIAAMSPG
jgi:DNA helicase-2/ATP-dependent DNA helicase PcrA